MKTLLTWAGGALLFAFLTVAPYTPAFPQEAPSFCRFTLANTLPELDKDKNLDYVVLRDKADIDKVLALASDYVVEALLKEDITAVLVARVSGGPPDHFQWLFGIEVGGCLLGPARPGNSSTDGPLIEVFLSFFPKQSEPGVGNLGR